MDKLIGKIVALGVPGLVLLVVISANGLTGAAATVAGIAAFGGPLGILGGLAVLGIAVLISQGIAKYGFEKICFGVIKNLQKEGKTKEKILEEIEKYPISKELKRKLKELLDDPESPTLV